LFLYRFINIVTRAVFFSVFPRKIYGRENLPAEGAAIIVCNHQYFYDVFHIATCFKRRIRFMAKKELFKKRWISWLFHTYGGFPVDRDNLDMPAMRKSLQILADGQVLCIFPEGTRQHEVPLLPLKEGVAFIAGKSRAPIVPAYVTTTGKLFKKCVLRVGKPFQLPEGRMDTAYLQNATQMIADAMLAQRDSSVAAVLEAHS